MFREKFAKLRKKAFDVNMYNPNLYVGEPENGEIKPEIVDFIIENMEYSGDSEVTNGTKSNDWYQPDDPGEAYLSVSGTLPMSKLVEKFGEFKSGDLTNLKEDLENNDHFENEVKDAANEFKDVSITNFSLDINVTVNSNEVSFSAEGEDIELDSF